VIRLLQGDCRAVLATLDADSLDACVTDPPYDLTAGKKGGTGAASVNLDSPYGRARTGNGAGGFMGMAWDATGVAFDPATWREVYRVLKPGAHLLAFSGTRTYHRMVCAIEDAGFEIRDQIGWAFGSGFPKSLDVSKAIDKAGGISTREQSALLKQRREGAGLAREQVAAAVGCTPSSVRDWEEGRARTSGGAVEFIVPSDDYRAKLAALLGYSADERRLIGLADDRREDGTVYGIGHSGAMRSGGNTEAARQWQGWGTALKPAWEPIVVARKPLIGTVAANVLAHGCGALNIDGCRVETADDLNGGAYSAERKPSESEWVKHGGTIHSSTGEPFVQPPGRWPANIIHDGSDEVLAAFPETSSGAPGIKRGGNTGAAYGAESRPPGTQMSGFGDSGSAARFFYTAKASGEDRNAGGQRVTGTDRNTHPTVKPTDLMRYLCRLVTPLGGTVLDPFAGSGSTLKAAELEGFSALGIELDPAYIETARRRIGSDAPLFAEVST
jgi:DNA modification methylase/transcriptional regulator with XRE-family HTH domain